MMQIQPLLEEALEQAVKDHFSKLFGVLMNDTSDQGIEHFRNGVQKLARTERIADDLIRKGMKT